MSDFVLIRVRTEDDLRAIKSLFAAYTEWLNLDLTFQGFQHELASLPGKYAPPKGELLLARRTSNAESLGCIAVRPLPLQNGSRKHQPVSEVKRLFVSPAARGLGVGQALVKECLSVARSLGYVEAKLDTLPHMTSAIKLYKSFGFIDCEQYYETPLEDTKFMSLDLTTLEMGPNIPAQEDL